MAPLRKELRFSIQIRRRSRHLHPALPLQALLGTFQRPIAFRMTPFRPGRRQSRQPRSLKAQLSAPAALLRPRAPAVALAPQRAVLQPQGERLDRRWPQQGAAHAEAHEEAAGHRSQREVGEQRLFKRALLTKDIHGDHVDFMLSHVDFIGFFCIILHNASIH